MLAGPPRLVSLLTILLLVGLGWWYLRLLDAPAARIPNLNVDTSAPPTGYKSDGLDFSLPPRFTEGFPKAPGENYSYVIVLPKTEKEDLDWIRQELPETKLVVYEVDNPNAENKVPKNKGREAMVCSMRSVVVRSKRLMRFTQVYLSYIIDHYNDLPDTVIFMHAHKVCTCASAALYGCANFLSTHGITTSSWAWTPAT